MIPTLQQLELRRVTVSCLLTCIYLPIIVTGISYKGLLYSVGKGSSFYILVLIFVAELLKAIYLNINNDMHSRRNRQSKTSVAEITKAFVVMLGVMFCFFIGIILFGAPALENHEETLMLSTLLTVLTAFPLVAHCGVELAVHYLFRVNTFPRDSVIEMLITNALLTVCGSWLGAVVIPLDWNTPWQQWPVPCYLGALGGFIISNVLVAVKVNASISNPLVNILVKMFNKIDGAK